MHHDRYRMIVILPLSAQPLLFQPKYYKYRMPVESYFSSSSRL